MKSIQIEKVTLNIGAGKDQAKLEKGLILLNSITNSTPIKTITNKRIQEWGLRPGLPIGCKITLRKEKALNLLPKLLEAIDNRLNPRQFDNNGNIAFGIHEYIEIPGVKYDPKIGIMGFEVCVTLQRPGFRIKKRRLLTRKIPTRHRISKQEAIDFLSNKFNIKVEEE
ncbi:MAG: 50S ribosomal protein L5 [Candidatus Woesearchaeota archaeon]|jgi:large subunit ribosomal protein L5|nr:50S ribosomal protein L5 [Candidatus Woesearchaeota archaeon]|tara:strand:- start:9854 stop:10357 length:504 start_codon:yes stop_codon:yes gene_type:complete